MTSDLTIRYVKYADIDKSRWDDAIDRACNGLPYAYSWYLDMMAGTWDALISEDYQYIMPLPYNRKWLGFKQIYQPHFTQQLGVFSKWIISDAIFKDFLSTIPPTFKHVACSCNETNPYLHLNGYQVVPRTNMILDLKQSYEAIRSAYRRSLRKRIDQGNNSLAVRVMDISPIDLVSQYKKELNYKIGLKDRDYTKVTELISLAISNGKGEIFSAHNRSGEALASIFFLKSHKRLIQLLGSATKEGKHLHAMHFLIDAVIKKFSDQDLLFDFEGSEIPSVAEFFRGFGPKEVKYHHIVKDNLPLMIRILRQLKR